MQPTRQSLGRLDIAPSSARMHAMKPRVRSNRRLAGALCALMLVFFLESSFCAAHVLCHLDAGPCCTQTHSEQSGCEAPHSSAPCPEDRGCSLHAHDQVLSPSEANPTSPVRDKAQPVLPQGAAVLVGQRLLVLVDSPPAIKVPSTPVLRLGTVLLI